MVGSLVRIRIHRGTREIGGTCVEVESAGLRIQLDLGFPLDTPDLAAAAVPEVEGLVTPSETLLAIVLSHGHRDHWGLIPKARPDIPLVMGLVVVTAIIVVVVNLVIDILQGFLNPKVRLS